MMMLSDRDTYHDDCVTMCAFYEEDHDEHDNDVNMLISKVLSGRKSCRIPVRTIHKS